MNFEHALMQRLRILCNWENDQDGDDNTNEKNLYNLANIMVVSLQTLFHSVLKQAFNSILLYPSR